MDTTAEFACVAKSVTASESAQLKSSFTEPMQPGRWLEGME